MKFIINFFVFVYLTFVNNGCTAQSISPNDNCSLKINYIQNNKTINFQIKNNTSNTVKIPEKIDAVFFSIIKIDKYNEEEKEYKFFISYDRHINCASPKCYGKFCNLKMDKEKEYSFSYIPYFVDKTKGKYRFKIRWDIFFSDCIEYETDWIYYEIK